jgi:hypothetical protein
MRRIITRSLFLSLCLIQTTNAFAAEDDDLIDMEESIAEPRDVTEFIGSQYQIGDKIILSMGDQILWIDKSNKYSRGKVEFISGDFRTVTIKLKRKEKNKKGDREKTPEIETKTVASSEIWKRYDSYRFDKNTVAKQGTPLRDKKRNGYAHVKEIFVHLTGGKDIKRIIYLGKIEGKKENYWLYGHKNPKRVPWMPLSAEKDAARLRARKEAEEKERQKELLSKQRLKQAVFSPKH